MLKSQRFQVSALSCQACQVEDNVSRGVLGGRATHQPSPRAAPEGQVQSWPPRLMNIFFDVKLGT